MSDRLRLFVGVAVPPEPVMVLQQHLASCAPELRDARWVDPSGAHLTLKFLGWVDASLQGEIEAVCAQSARTVPSVSLRFAELGAFPRFTRARVLWVGVRDPASVVVTLASMLDSRLAGIGFKAETKPYRPHVTLARLRSPRRLSSRLSPLPAAAGFEMRTVTLYRSHVGNRGARYEGLGQYELLG